LLGEDVTEEFWEEGKDVTEVGLGVEIGVEIGVELELRVDAELVLIVEF
jgi:hypothetical protein